MTNFFGHAKSAKKGYFKIQHNFRLTFACPNALKRLYIFAPKTIIYFLIINFRTPTLYVVALGVEDFLSRQKIKSQYFPMTKNNFFPPSLQASMNLRIETEES